MTVPCALIREHLFAEQLSFDTEKAGLFESDSSLRETVVQFNLKKPPVTQCNSTDQTEQPGGEQVEKP